LFSGELHDPFNEFFVSSNPELANYQYMNGLGALAADGGFAGESLLCASTTVCLKPHAKAFREIRMN
jgi:hypothetical protein